MKELKTLKKECEYKTSILTTKEIKKINNSNFINVEYIGYEIICEKRYNHYKIIGEYNLQENGYTFRFDVNLDLNSMFLRILELYIENETKSKKIQDNIKRIQKNKEKKKEKEMFKKLHTLKRERNRNTFINEDKDDLILKFL